jgi:hypothetical protein
MSSIDTIRSPQSLFHTLMVKNLLQEMQGMEEKTKYRRHLAFRPGRPAGDI